MSEKIAYVTDELENAIDYLEQVVFYYRQVDYKHRFKWLMISLHGALYGFGVCAIKGSSATQTVYKPLESIMKKKKLEEVKRQLAEEFAEYDEKYIDSMSQLRNGQLLSIWDVLDRCQMDEYMMRYTESKSLDLDENQVQAIAKLVLYRNHLVHFKPMTYGIMGDYGKDIVLPVVEVIKFLALESNNILYRTIEEKERVKKTVEEIEYQ